MYDLDGLLAFFNACPPKSNESLAWFLSGDSSMRHWRKLYRKACLRRPVPREMLEDLP